MNKRNHGFTLIEISMVLIIVGYLLKQFVVPFGASYQQKIRQQSFNQLESIKQALDGFAIARQRLPCPASEHSAGVALKVCLSTSAIGYVPAVTLGLRGPLDVKGRLLDPWGSPIVYAVSASDSETDGIQGQPDFTTTGEMGRVGLSNLRSDLIVCRKVHVGQCARNEVRANQVPYVLLSYGKDRSSSGQQTFNQDQDALFVARAFSQHTAKNVGFDDIVVWASESQLIYTLVKAGSLP